MIEWIPDNVVTVPRYLYTVNAIDSDLMGVLVDFYPPKNAVRVDGEWFPVEDYGNYYLCEEYIDYDIVVDMFTHEGGLDG